MEWILKQKYILYKYKISYTYKNHSMNRKDFLNLGEVK